ncbi:MAG: efflux RND transporter periplasmic adaptor subunit [Pseudorhodobacter sp.]
MDGVTHGAKIGALVALVACAGPAGAQSGVPESTICLILPHEVVELAMPVDGVVEQLAVDRGDHVETQQVVVRLDVSLEMVELEAARARSASFALIEGRQARLGFLQAEAERTARLVERSAAAERLSEEARMSVETARADLAEAVLARRIAGIDAEAASTRMERKTIRSPITGVVTKRDVAVGEFRATGAPLLTVARIDRLRAEVFVPIAFHPRLQVGQEVTIVPEAPFDADYKATIAVIDHVFDAATGTFGIVMDLPNPNLTLPAGLRCRVRFD